MKVSRVNIITVETSAKANSHLTFTTLSPGTISGSDGSTGAFEVTAGSITASTGVLTVLGMAATAPITTTDAMDAGTTITAGTNMVAGGTVTSVGVSSSAAITGSHATDGLAVAASVTAGGSITAAAGVLTIEVGGV